MGPYWVRVFRIWKEHDIPNSIKFSRYFSYIYKIIQNNLNETINIKIKHYFRFRFPKYQNFESIRIFSQFRFEFGTIFSDRFFGFGFFLPALVSMLLTLFQNVVCLVTWTNHYFTSERADVRSSVITGQWASKR